MPNETMKDIREVLRTGFRDLDSAYRDYEMIVIGHLGFARYQNKLFMRVLHT
jgi:hypothetical protein